MDAKKHYDTGAVRSGDCEATRYDLISPIGLEALARTYAEGARKFGAFNWENGMPVTDLLNHAIAHIYKFLNGNRDEDHLAHAAWNLLGAIHSLAKWPELNDQWLRKSDGSIPLAAKKPPASNCCQNQTAETGFSAPTPETVELLKQIKTAILAAKPDKK
jgi:hypothetical protein